MKKIAFSLLFITYHISAYAQNQIQQIDSMVSLRNADYELSGNVLIAEKGKLIYQRSTGIANTSKNTPVTASSAFHLAPGICLKDFYIGCNLTAH